MFDAKTRISKLLEPADIDIIQSLFGPALHPEAILDAIMVAPIPANKLQPTSKTGLPGGPATFYICKFSTSWILYNTAAQTDRPLIPSEISMIKKAFSAAINESAIVVALQVTPISLNKLQQLTTRQSVTSDKTKPTAPK